MTRLESRVTEVSGHLGNGLGLAVSPRVKLCLVRHLRPVQAPWGQPRSAYIHLSIYLSINLSMHLCIYVSIYVCAYVYISIYVSMYLCIYVPMYLCTYVSMHLCMYALKNK